MLCLSPETWSACVERWKQFLEWWSFTNEKPLGQEVWPMRCWWLWGRKGSVTIQIVNFALEEWSCRDHGLWPPAAYWKVMIELSKWQMALEFFNYPFAHYELYHPKLAGAEWRLVIAPCWVQCTNMMLWEVPGGKTGSPGWHPAFWGPCGQWTKQLTSESSPKDSQNFSLYMSRGFAIYIRSFVAEAWD